MSSSISRQRLLFIVLACGMIGAGFVYSLALGNLPRFPDEKDYMAIAGHLLRGSFSLDGQTPTALRPPGYPIGIAVPVALSDSYHSVRIAQFGLVVMTAWCLSRLLLIKPAHYWAASTVMLLATFGYPAVLYAAGTLFPQVYQLSAIALVIYLLQSPVLNRIRACGIGLVSAFASLLSPTALMLMPAALVFLFFRRYGKSSMLIAMIAFAMPIALWTARNMVVLDQPIVFSKNLAWNIDNAVLEASPEQAVSAREPKDAVQYGVERLLQIVSEPQIYLSKLAGFFAYRNDMHVVSESSPTRDAVMFISYYSLILLVLVRLLLSYRRPLQPLEWLVIGLYLATALFHALVFTRIRYRIPFDYCLIPVAVNSLLIMFPTLAYRLGIAVSLTRKENAKTSSDELV